MVKNVAGARWPLKQLEWIIVDDSDEGKGLDAQVEELREQAADLTVRYVRLTPSASASASASVSIGAKRNAAVAAASEGTDLFVCMDDDDHYPEDSIGRRVSWITDGKRGAVYCSTIPMYDTTRYISAMNAPPMILGAAQRISEATLAFTRAFWTARPFPDVSMAEGEGFVVGRESATVEIPPYGVIVSFIHKTNTSSRRVPVEQPANGCHYGFTDEFFTLVTELGMK
jgi:glycosyltransferase involved in cell wall biosynthesis